MPFTPASIASCKLWLDPTRSVTVSGGHVTAWADQQLNVATFLNVGTGITQGASTLLFDGASYLEAFGSPLSTFISASAYWAAFVWRYTGNTAEAATPLNAWLLGSSGTYWEKTISATAFDNAHFDTAYRVDQVAVSGTGLHYAICKYDGTKLYTSLDGAPFDAGTAAGNVGSVSDSPLLIGVSSNGSVIGAPFHKGEIGDIAAGNAVLSDADFASLVGWVKGRYFPTAGGPLALALAIA